MFMRSLRDNTKWMMAAAMFIFAGWLVFDWVANRDAASATGFNPVVGVVNGEEIRYGQFSRILEGALASARSGGFAILAPRLRRITCNQGWRMRTQWSAKRPWISWSVWTSNDAPPRARSSSAQVTRSCGRCSRSYSRY